MPNNISVYEINEADKELAVCKYQLTTSELFEAEKLYYRSSFSWMASAKVIKNRRQTT